MKKLRDASAPEKASKSTPPPTSKSFPRDFAEYLTRFNQEFPYLYYDGFWMAWDGEFWRTACIYTLEREFWKLLEAEANRIKDRAARIAAQRLLIARKPHDSYYPSTAFQEHLRQRQHNAADVKVVSGQARFRDEYEARIEEYASEGWTDMGWVTKEDDYSDNDLHTLLVRQPPQCRTSFAKP